MRTLALINYISDKRTGTVSYFLSLLCLQCPVSLSAQARTRPRYDCSPGGGSAYLNRWQTSPGSDSNRWHGCGKSRNRSQEWRRHIVSIHLQDHLYCPNSVCPWRGHREDARKRHTGSGKYGPKPENEEQRMIYDPELILGWIFERIISAQVAEMTSFKKGRVS